MEYVVAKNFKTVNRRFVAGMPIMPEEVIGRVTFDMWKERGFIVEGSVAHVGDMTSAPVNGSVSETRKKAPPAP